MENENTGTQVPLGCTCGQPRMVGVMHRSEGPCQLVYAAVPVSQAKPDALIDCPDCKGNGIVFEGGKPGGCDTCGGTGASGITEDSVRDAALEEVIAMLEASNHQMCAPCEVRDIVAAIRALKAKPEGDGWISVEDRLPQENVGVLVTCAELGFDKSGPTWWDGHGFGGYEWEFDFSSQFSNGAITHWMPLPAPPAATKPEGGD